jgi:response regulator RpfG family c-di-GMP phosphodiesterase
MAASEKESVILVVDDDEAVVQSVSALLELETPHRVLFETSPPRAVDLVRENPVDLVISDFLMPDMNGISFLLEVRGLYPESTLVLLTGYADKENAIRAINEVGIFQYLEKPWDNDDILTVVRQGLDKRLQLHRLHERARELEARLRKLEEVNRELERRLQERGS